MDTTGKIIAVLMYVLLLMFMLFQHYDIIACQESIAAYKQQIAQLHLAAEQQAEDAELAYQAAQRQVRQIQDKSQTILRTKVPKDCNLAIKWIIEQAHSL